RAASCGRGRLYRSLVANAWPALARETDTVAAAEAAYASGLQRLCPAALPLEPYQGSLVMPKISPALPVEQSLRFRLEGYSCQSLNRQAIVSPARSGTSASPPRFNSAGTLQSSFFKVMLSLLRGSR